MKNVCVRRATREDASTLVEFQCCLARESEGLELNHATVTRGVGAVLADTNKGCYWVAEERGRIVGCLLTVPEWSDWRNATVLWLHSVYVVPEARRHGVFRELYLSLKAAVEGFPGLAGIRLYVNKQNRAAQEAYEALGMSREHYHLYEWLKDR